MEEWKDIRDYEGLYQISNLGRVKSIGCYKYVGVTGHNRRLKYIKRELVMKPTDNGNGYLIVSLKKLGKRKNHYVHRLVAEYFIENPLNKGYVNHIDYNTKNNKVENLEWVTQKENVRHSSWKIEGARKNCKKSNTGEKYITKKPNRYEVTINNKDVKVFKSFQTLDMAIAFRNEVLDEFGIAI